MRRIERWDDLRFFLAVARTGTLAAAARQLGVNQSTVLRRVAHFEDGLGARLFDRQPRGYELTSVGEDMVELASRVEEDVMAFDRAVAGADLELHGLIALTTVDEVMERIAPHLRSFRERYPGITLDVNTELRLFSLARREADVAVRPGTAPTEPDIISRRLAGLAFAAYASVDYLDGRETPLTTSDLRDHWLIGLSGDRGRHFFTRYLADADEQRVVYRANSMVGLAQAAAAGVGVAVLPCFMGDCHPSLRRLIRLESADDHALWLLYHADLRQTARVRAFIDFIADALMGDAEMFEGRLVEA